MTRFADTSDVGRANLAAHRTAVRIRPETADVIEAALAWARASDGAFDPCLGKVSAAWEVTERTRPPAPTSLRRLAGRALWQALDVDRGPGGSIVRFEDPDVALDLGGIAKGYGVDRAVTALRERGVERGLVNVGGDLYALGTSEDGDAWRVGIRSPDDPNALAGRIDVQDQAVATSGDYERYFRHEGRIFHHLLDPDTAAPRTTDRHSVSVVAATCIDADAAATAAFGLPRAAAESALRAGAPGAHIVSNL